MGCSGRNLISRFGGLGEEESGDKGRAKKSNIFVDGFYSWEASKVTPILRLVACFP